MVGTFSFLIGFRFGTRVASSQRSIVPHLIIIVAQTKTKLKHIENSQMACLSNLVPIVTKTAQKLRRKQTG